MPLPGLVRWLRPLARSQEVRGLEAAQVVVQPPGVGQRAARARALPRALPVPQQVQGRALGRSGPWGAQ